MKQTQQQKQTTRTTTIQKMRRNKYFYTLRISILRALVHALFKDSILLLYVRVVKPFLRMSVTLSSDATFRPAPIRIAVAAPTALASAPFYNLIHKIIELDRQRTSIVFK